MSKENEEIEIVFLEVDVPALEARLTDIGARKIGDMFYQNVAFDYPDFRLDADNSWIRVRSDGKRVELTFKKRLGVKSQDGSANDEGMEEIEVEVSDYEKTKELLFKIGFVEKHEAEKKRTRWEKDGVTFDIDTWPEIPTFLEIEADSWEDVDKAIGWLGFNKEDGKICSATQIYRMYGIDMNEYQKVRFDGLMKKGK
jgi:adenylate cyclase class 2